MAGTTASGRARFGRAELTAALRAICADTGLDHRGAELLRFTNNAVFRLPGDAVVVRIVGSHAMRHRAAKVVAVAAWLAEHGVPAVRLLPGVAQPVTAGEHLATLWLAEPGTGRAPDGADLAGLLRRIHGLAPPDGLPLWAPLDDVRRRLSDAEELAPGDREFLQRRCAELQDALDSLLPTLASAVVHGDAHLGNLIPAEPGPLICDFDSTSIGPPEWDLTAVPVGVRRFGHPVQVERALCAGYGRDVTAEPAYPVLAGVRELKLTTSVLPIVRSHPAVRTELRRRLHDLRTGTQTEHWQNFR